MKRLQAVVLALGMALVAPKFALAQQAGEFQADMVVGQELRSELIDGAIRQVHDHYVFPDMGKKVEAALRLKQKQGVYDPVTSAKKLSELMSEHMQAVTKDKHLSIYYNEQPRPPQENVGKPSASEQAARLVEQKARNFGVERVERLPFNIGYLDLRGFISPKASAGAIAAAMTLVANTEALIIDLRRNGGGDPGTGTLLASYLLKERTEMNSFYFRETNRVEQRWSSDVVMGERFGHEKDVYILTSNDTFSAAEDFSFAMKNLKRVTIVGETTGGGAHAGKFVRLHPHFDMFVPNGRAFNPATNTNWEVVGVAPDVSVKAEDALKVAQVAALRKLAASEKNSSALAALKSRIAKVEAEDTRGSLDE